MSDDQSRSNSPSFGIKDMSIEPETVPVLPRPSKATKSSAKKTTKKPKHVPGRREMSYIKAKGDDTSNFMADFDPTKSRREKTRNTKKVDYSEGGGQKSKGAVIFNEKGVHKTSGMDSCDCLKEDCPGCHFPCPKCKSTKCGFECRQSRKWQVEFIINEDSSIDKRMNKYAVQTMKK